ncbi:conserved hypothetical protein [Planktothrix serta PCC 8927]|uniref:DUF2442 domain-containing protein n=1 Tax=Planktothrix serta PCC 8927 TaxID=671068 RepID=A0A7Z9E129_9CYAN|nr:DUF2442 domain-containing protein [Planktothrix serta]VXD20407.1 conserved hypothetical protein [Planktothrix serta PCC 8927]
MKNNNKGEQELIEENLLEEIAKAKQAWQEAEATEPRAISVKYDQDQDLIVIHLKNGSIFSFPPRLAQGLAEATPEQLADFWIPPSGKSIHWDSLDVDFGIPELVRGIFGTKSWMAELGRKDGQSTSKAKSEAARKNGKKGGRPKNVTL